MSMDVSMRQVASSSPPGELLLDKYFYRKSKQYGKRKYSIGTQTRAQQERAPPYSRREIIGTLSKSLRLALIRLPEVNFPQNETLRMYVGCIQP